MEESSRRRRGGRCRRGGGVGEGEVDGVEVEFQYAAQRERERESDTEKRAGLFRINPHNIPAWKLGKEHVSRTRPRLVRVQGL